MVVLLSVLVDVDLVFILERDSISDDAYKCISGKPSSAKCLDATKVRLLDAIAALLKGNFVQLKTLPKSKVDAKELFGSQDGAIGPPKA